MIIQSLVNLYDRLFEDRNMRDKIATPGWSPEKVSWELILEEDGHVVDVCPITTDEKRAYQTLMVPEHFGRSGSKPAPYFLCDKASFLLGLNEKNGASNRQRSAELHEAVLSECDDPAARAVLSFFARDDADHDLSSAQQEALAEGKMVTFSLDYQGNRVFDAPSVREAWTKYREESREEGVMGYCSVTGEYTRLARLFPQVTGVRGAQSSGASLVSYNFDASESYGKRQSYNASISEGTAYKAGMALKYLLGDKDRLIHIGGTIVVAWTDSPQDQDTGFFTPDALLSSVLGRPAEDHALNEAVQKAFIEMKCGRPLSEFDASTGYYVLGIAPNMARLSVRFFETGTLGELAEKYGQYLRDMEMIRVKPMSFRQIVDQAARKTRPKDGESKRKPDDSKKEEGSPSTLIARTYSAMMGGTEFPRSLEQMVLERTRVDHAQADKWDLGQRASIFRACLVRRARRRGDLEQEKEVTVSLNRECKREGYLLGRLFAVMERAQHAALGDTNATIRDRYLGAAAMTPARVFGSLMRGYSAHFAAIRKDKPGLALYFDKEFGEILSKLSVSDDGAGAFPKILSQDEQELFFIGFYQQLWDEQSSSSAKGETE